MREDNWRRDPPLPRARPVGAGTPAKEYYAPDVKKVAVSIRGDEEGFIPSPCDEFGFSYIVANIPSGSLVMPEGGSATIDCGFSLEVPSGYRCVVSSLVPGLVLESVDSQRFKVNAVNLGSETILSHKETIGRIKIEPVHFFEWVNRG